MWCGPLEIPVLNSAHFILTGDFFGGAGDGVGEGEGLCVGPDVPRGFGLCHAGMLGVPLLRSMRASSVARVVAAGCCAGCSDPGRGACAICGALVYVFYQCPFHFLTRF
jgi:hypothetical protein